MRVEVYYCDGCNRRQTAKAKGWGSVTFSWGYGPEAYRAGYYCGTCRKPREDALEALVKLVPKRK